MRWMPIATAVTLAACGSCGPPAGSADGAGGSPETTPAIVDRLTEPDRRAIFTQLAACEEAAERAADAEFPELDILHPEYRSERVMDLADDREAFRAERYEPCAAGVRERRAISEDEAGRIAAEGRREEWPEREPTPGG